MASLVSENVTSTFLEKVKRIHDLREPMPPLAAKFALPVVLGAAVLTTIPPPGAFRVTIGMVTFFALWSYALLNWTAGPAFFLDSLLITSITFRWFLVFLAGTPEIDYRQISPTATVLTGEGPWHEQLYTKLKWSIEFWSSWRGVGWNYEDRHLHKGSEQTQSRLRFIATHLAMIVFNSYTSQFVTNHAYCSAWPGSINLDPGVDFASLPAVNKHMIVGIQLIRDALMLDTEYRKLAVVCVALHLSSPDRFPPLFANPLDLCSVRNFWGRCWHQTFRDLFTKCSDWAADIVGAKKGTLFSKYLKLYIGFIASGIQHYGPTLMINSPKYAWGMFWQMPTYAVVVTAEDIIKHHGKRMGIQDEAFVRSVGYIWTFYWMTLIYGLPVGYFANIGIYAGSCG